MTERISDERPDEQRMLPCPTCATPYRAGDHFCAQCGASLPPPAAPLPESSPPEAHPPENTAWLLGARPAAVMGGGLLLLLLAVLLLFIGQRDDTGTIVMLAICTAPLGLLTIVIGIGRYVAGAARRG